MKFVQTLSIFVLIVSLIGCTLVKRSSGENGKQSYLTAQNVPPLNIPPGLSSDRFHNMYPIPNRTYARVTQPVSLVPPTLYP